MDNVQLLLLAAGGSRRMGEPKQLLPWGIKTLIEHQIDTLLDTHKSVSVMLGAYAEKIKPIIEKFPITIYINENWESGMGTSIAKGVKQVIEQKPNADGILISLIDQPLLTTTHFNKMLELFQPEHKHVIVSKANDRWAGAPVIFDKFYFEELMCLEGDQGAKKVTNLYRDFVKSIDGGDLLIDIDTPETYRKVLNKFRRNTY